MNNSDIDKMMEDLEWDIHEPIPFIPYKELFIVALVVFVLICAPVLSFFWGLL